MLKIFSISPAVWSCVIRSQRRNMAMAFFAVYELQATSSELQASSYELQATSYKLRDMRNELEAKRCEI
jgi:hypothetical protein